MQISVLKNKRDKENQQSLHPFLLIILNQFLCWNKWFAMKSYPLLFCHVMLWIVLSIYPRYNVKVSLQNVLLVPEKYVTKSSLKFCALFITITDPEMTLMKHHILSRIFTLILVSHSITLAKYESNTPILLFFVLNTSRVFELYLWITYSCEFYK